MNKKLERLKKDLIEITDAVNSFSNENVQVIVIDRVLNHFNNTYSTDTEMDIPVSVSPEPSSATNTGNIQADKHKGDIKKMGATRIIKKLLSSEFFDAPKSISAIAKFCADNYNITVYTYQVLGILLSLIKENKLTRVVSQETNRYVYLKQTVT